MEKSKKKKIYKKIDVVSFYKSIVIRTGHPLLYAILSMRLFT